MIQSVTVFGTGALGMLFAARIASDPGPFPGLPRPTVTVAGHWRDSLDAMRRRGIAIEDGQILRAVQVNVLDLGPSASDPSHVTDRSDIVLVLVKSYQTGDVATDVARAVRPDGLVVTLQNGLGNAQILSPALQADPAASGARVVQGTTTAAATLMGPGRIRAGGRGATVLEAPADGHHRELAAELVRLFGAAGLGAAALTDDIRPHLWTKLLAACSLLPLAAIYRLPNGSLINLPEARERLARAAAETAAVGRSQGIRLPDDPVAPVVAIAMATAGNRASMLQDVERQRPTEIEATCGQVVRLGRASGVPTPELERLLRDVRALEGRSE